MADFSAQDALDAFLAANMPELRTESRRIATAACAALRELGGVPRADEEIMYGVAYMAYLRPYIAGYRDAVAGLNRTLWPPTALQRHVDGGVGSGGKVRPTEAPVGVDLPKDMEKLDRFLDANLPGLKGMSATRAAELAFAHRRARGVEARLEAVDDRIRRYRASAYVTGYREGLDRTNFAMWPYAAPASEKAADRQDDARRPGM